MRWLVAGLLVCTVAGAAHADEKGDQAYAAGQFTGAATFCGIEKARVSALAKAMLDAFGVDSSEPGPEMTRFQQGVTDGVTEMKTKEPASCDEVKQGFEMMEKK